MNIHKTIKTYIVKSERSARSVFGRTTLPTFSRCVIQKYVIPELHILQGFVKHLFWIGLVPLLGREKTLLWPHNVGAIAKNYHGEIFEGNACRKLLAHADQLFIKEITDEVGKFQIVPFVSAFKAMDKVFQDFLQEMVVMN